MVIPTDPCEACGEDPQYCGCIHHRDWDEEPDDEEDDIMPRTHYRNGDEITLPCGCDGCSPSRINGILCHEAGCRESWRDHRVECFECGCDFYPENRGQGTCEDCIAAVYDAEVVDTEDDDEEEDE